MPRQAPDVALYIIKSLAIKKAQDYITSGSVLTIDEEIIKAFCPYQKEAQSFLTHFIKEVERDLKRHDIGIYVKRLAIKRGLRQAYAGYDFNEKHVWHEATSLPGYEAIYFNEYKSAFDGYIPKKSTIKREPQKKKRHRTTCARYN